MNYEKFIFNISTIILVFIFLISIILCIILVKKFLNRLLEILLRFGKKFPNRSFYQLHFGLIFVMLIKSVTNMQQESKTEKKKLIKDDIKKYPLFKLLFFLIYIKIKKILEMIFLFIMFFLISPFVISPTLNKTIFRNNTILKFLSEFFFYYLYYITLIIFIGYKVAEFNNRLSIALICIYIALIFLTCSDKFKPPIDIKEINKNYKISTFFNLLLGLVVGFASLYYNISQINPDNFNTKISFINSIYFSIITFATVGYGDIYPKTELAKSLVSVEILCSIFTLVFLASAFISWRTKNLAKDE